MMDNNLGQPGTHLNLLFIVWRSIFYVSELLQYILGY